MAVEVRRSRATTSRSMFSSGVVGEGSQEGLK